ncbi:MAG: acetolactate synthase small subunit [Campylobacterales bacterium]|nr:acetolactate synthase small subunit [Campylobacterales bacterium]
MTEIKINKVISVIVKNEHSVLSRISGLFAGRGYNIQSLTVAPIPETNLSRFTIKTSGDKRVIEQIIKQLNKLIPVLKVIQHDGIIEKEMAIVKIPIEESLADIDALCRAYNGKIVNVSEDSIVTMVADEPERVENFLKAIKKYHPKEIVKGGSVAIEQ